MRYLLLTLIFCSIAICILFACKGNQNNPQIEQLFEVKIQGQYLIVEDSVKSVSFKLSAITGIIGPKNGKYTIIYMHNDGTTVRIPYQEIMNVIQANEK